MDHVIINYSKRVYDRKIAVLESDIEELDRHEKELLALSEKIKTVWRDENGLKFYDYVTQRLHSIAQERQTAKSMLEVYRDLVSDLGQANSSLSETFGMIEGVLSGVVSSGGK